MGPPAFLKGLRARGLNDVQRLVETLDEWAVSERRYLSEEPMAKIGQPVITVEEATLAITA